MPEGGFRVSENRDTQKKELEQAITQALDALTRAQQLIRADLALGERAELKKEQTSGETPEENDGNIPPRLLGKPPRLQ
jgi:hypothetical protein